MRHSSLMPSSFHETIPLKPHKFTETVKRPISQAVKNQNGSAEGVSSVVEKTSKLS